MKRCTQKRPRKRGIPARLQGGNCVMPMIRLVTFIEPPLAIRGRFALWYGGARRQAAEDPGGGYLGRVRSGDIVCAVADAHRIRGSRLSSGIERASIQCFMTKESPTRPIVPQQPQYPSDIRRQRTIHRRARSHYGAARRRARRTTPARKDRLERYPSARRAARCYPGLAVVSLELVEPSPAR